MIIAPRHEWATAAFPASQRVEAWEDALNRVYGSWEIQYFSSKNFNARMVHRSSGGLQIVECICDPCSAIRTRANVANDATETITLQLALSGSENFTFGDRRVSLGSGDVILWNSTHPMKFAITEPLHKISVTMPLARLKGWLPDRWHSIEGVLPRLSGGANLLKSFIELVSPAYLAGSLANSEALSSTLRIFAG